MNVAPGGPGSAGPAGPAGSADTVASRPHGAAVLAVSAAFAGAGLTMASAVSRMPEIKEQVDASATELAFALVCIGIGSLVAMPFAGRLSARFGTAAVVSVFATIACTGWALIPLAGSVPTLAAVLLLTGVGVGTWDVAMNVQGSLVERARGQVLMPMLHGLFSVGAVVGALAGAGAARLGIPLGVQLPVVSVVLWAVVVAGCRAFLPNRAVERVVVSTIHDVSLGGTATSAPGAAGAASDGDAAAGTPVRPAVPTAEGGPAGAGRRGGLFAQVLIGLIMFGTAVGEGAANDWLAIALVDERGAAVAVGALTFAGFNVTMALGRFAGGPLIARFGRVAALRVSGMLGLAGVLLIVFVPGTAAGLAGAALWGLGFAVVFPSGVSAAGEMENSEQAIATVSTIGYGGFLLGAPLIGTLAHVVPLLDALLVVAGFAVVIFLLAPAARERDRAATQ